MFDLLRLWVLRVTHVPPEPAPPFGAPGSLRVFRAGRNFLALRLVRWGLGQTVGLVGLGFSIFFLSWFKSDVEAAWRAAENAPVEAAVAPGGPPAPADTKAIRGKRSRRPNPIPEIARHTSGWMIVVLEVFEGMAILFFVAQVPVSFLVVRLEFDLHWYMVTDRSLRIRTGILSLQESTMSFANIQQVEVQQGPLQRLLGLADVHVQSAGGGGDQDRRHTHSEASLHTGVFQSVENATEIRDLILERLRKFRQTGLGDPDDHHEHAPANTVSSPRGATPSDSDTLVAARELLEAARELRASLR